MTGGHGSLRMSSVFVFFTVRSMSFLLCHLGRDPDDRSTGDVLEFAHQEPSTAKEMGGHILVITGMGNIAFKD